MIIRPAASCAAATATSRSVLRSERLQAGGAPVKVRLLGKDFVAYRSLDNTVGLVDERCPHRCA